MIESAPKFVQGIASFEGRGIETPVPLGASFAYSVPSDKRAQLIYFRAGNSSPELLVLALMLDGKLMRYFPIGAKADSHTSLAVVEDLEPDSKLELFVAAPTGASGKVVIDLGLMEV